MNKYKTIVADPPWKYGTWGKASKPNYEGHIPKESDIPYETMSVEEIKALNVASLADENCELYLWTTQKYLPDAFEVLKAWGFKYCQTLTWCKTPMGTGQGGVFCPTTEFLLLGRKGKMPKVTRIDTTWWNVKRAWKTHSKKPEFFQDMIEKITDVPRLEMFARRKREGWDVWGNEVESDIDLMAVAKQNADYKGGFMPDIKVKQEVEYEVNIDVYCGTCGKGLCGDTTVDNRRMSFTVEACPHCMAEKDEKIKELEGIIEKLEAAACI